MLDPAKTDLDSDSMGGATGNIAGADKTGRPADPSDKRQRHSVSHSSSRGKKRRNMFIFLLGSLFGLVAAGFFAKSNDLIDFPEIRELTMDSFFDVLPAGLMADIRDLVVSHIPTIPTTLFSHCFPDLCLHFLTQH